MAIYCKGCLRPRGHQEGRELWQAHEAPLSMLAHGVDVGLGDIEEVGAHAVLPLGA